MDAEERNKLAFSLAGDSVKQVLTLSSAMLAFTVTFSTDVTEGATAADERWLWATWALLAVSILAGVVTLLSLVGVLGSPDSTPDVYADGVRKVAGAQMLAFAAALIAAAAFGVFALTGEAPKSDSGKCTIEAPATGECSLNP